MAWNLLIETNHTQKLPAYFSSEFNEKIALLSKENFLRASN